MKKKPSKINYLLLVGTLFWIIFLGSFFVVKGEDLSVTCDLTNVDKNCAALGPDKCQDLLKKCLNYYEEQSKLYENKLKENQSKRKSLQSTIYYLENKIKKLVSIGGSITYSMCMVAKGAFNNYIAHFNSLFSRYNNKISNIDSIYIKLNSLNPN